MEKKKDQTEDSPSSAIQVFTEGILKLDSTEVLCDCELSCIDLLHLLIRPDDYGKDFNDVDFSSWDNSARDQIVSGMCPCGIGHYYQLSVDDGGKGHLERVNVEPVFDGMGGMFG